MKTIIRVPLLILALFLLLHFNANAQCAGANNWPTNTITGPSPGQSVLVATDNYSGDYFEVYFNNDVWLRVTSSIETDIFYIQDMSTGNFLTSTFSTFGGFANLFPAGSLIRIHVWSNTNCLPDQINRTTTLIGIQPCVSGTNSSGTFVYNSPTNGVAENIFDQNPPYCSYAGEFTQVNFQPGKYKIESTVSTDHLTITSTASNLFNASTGFVTVTFQTANIRNIHLLANANCSSQSSCRDIIITCLTCTTAPTTTTQAATNITQVGATLNGSANANNLSNCAVAFQWGTTTAYGNTTSPATPISGLSNTAVSANITGLAPATVYNFRTVVTVAGQNPVYGANQTFTTLALSAPTATTNAASNITQVTATLNGSANANLNTNCSAAFEWGTTTAYGNTTSPATPVSGSTSTTVTSNLSGLTPNTVYNYRTVLTRPGQSNIYGSNQTFTTLALIAPTVSTSAASSVSSYSAILNASANANYNPNCTVSFEWGTTTQYGNTTAPVVPVTGSSATPVSFNLTSLSPGTTYNYRAVLSRPGQSSVTGSNQTFTTTIPTSSTELFVTNIAFDKYSNATALYQSQPTGAATYLNISVPSSQLDLPIVTNMNFPASNPNNYVSPGKTVNIYAKIRNQLSQATSLTLVYMRKSGVDPYISIIDSSSNVNNVAPNNSLWQDANDPFTFQISPSTPPGHVALFDFVVRESGSDYLTYAVKVPVNPFGCTPFGAPGGSDSWFSDDPSPDSDGNNNGIIEPGERIETKIDFDNLTNFSFDYLFGELISQETNILIRNNWAGASGNVSSKDWWNPFQSTLNTINPYQASITSTTDKVFDYNFTVPGEFNLLVNQSVIYSSIGNNRTYIKYRVSTDLYNQGLAPVTIDEIMYGPDFQVYPNPANEQVFIVVAENSMSYGNLEAIIFDYQGKAVKQMNVRTQRTLLGREDFGTAGIYNVVLRNREKGTSATRRIIIN